MADIDAHLDAAPVPLGRRRAPWWAWPAATSRSPRECSGWRPTTGPRSTRPGIDVAEVTAFVDRLVAMTVDERRALPFMHPGRADVIGAGALILSRVLRAYAGRAARRLRGRHPRRDRLVARVSRCLVDLVVGHRAAMSTQQTDEPLGAVVHRLSEQLPELVRSEIRLAQAELTEKGKRAGAGLGLFGAAGAGRALRRRRAARHRGDPARPGAPAVAVGADRHRRAAPGGAGPALHGRAQVVQATPPAPERADRRGQGGRRSREGTPLMPSKRHPRGARGRHRASARGAGLHRQRAPGAGAGSGEGHREAGRRRGGSRRGASPSSSSS